MKGAHADDRILSRGKHALAALKTAYDNAHGSVKGVRENDHRQILVHKFKMSPRMALTTRSPNSFTAMPCAVFGRHKEIYRPCSSRSHWTKVLFACLLFCRAPHDKDDVQRT